MEPETSQRSCFAAIAWSASSAGPGMGWAACGRGPLTANSLKTTIRTQG
jgi:hypothetical protein